MPNETALKGRITEIGDRVWNDELQCVMIAEMGKWSVHTRTRVKKLAGLVLCLTGTAWTNRSVIESMIRAEGGKPVRSMTSNGTILVDANAGPDSGDGAGKVRAAKRLGAKIIPAHRLKAVLNGEVSIDQVLNIKRKSVEPIDRERQREIEQAIYSDIESIAFGK